MIISLRWGRVFNFAQTLINVINFTLALVAIFQIWHRPWSLFLILHELATILIAQYYVTLRNTHAQINIFTLRHCVTVT